MCVSAPAQTIDKSPYAVPRAAGHGIEPRNTPWRVKPPAVPGQRQVQVVLVQMWLVQM